MSYKYREGLESVADEISKLKFKDMWSLASYLSQALREAGDDDGAEYFAHTLAAWADGINDEYEERIREEND